MVGRTAPVKLLLCWVLWYGVQHCCCSHRKWQLKSNGQGMVLVGWRLEGAIDEIWSSPVEPPPLQRVDTIQLVKVQWFWDLSQATSPHPLHKWVDCKSMLLQYVKEKVSAKAKTYVCF